jgi:anti-sigma B factor antagonist
MTFNVTRRSACCVLRIEGELDALSTPALKPSMGQIAEEGPPEVLVDLSALRLIDSVGVGAIIALYKSVRAYQGNLSVSGARDQPLAILKLLQLDRFLMGAPAPQPATRASSNPA